MLALPDHRQLTSHGCGVCALTVVWDYFGVRSRWVPDSEIDGIGPDAMEAALWNSGLRVQAGSWDTEDLKYLTRRGRPVICCVQHSSGEGHWIVVKGVERGFVYFNCPTDGPQRERIADFEQRWTDSTRRGTQYRQWGIAAWTD